LKVTSINLAAPNETTTKIRHPARHKTLAAGEAGLRLRPECGDLWNLLTWWGAESRAMSTIFFFIPS
jgi:hypothetical protein